MAHFGLPVGLLESLTDHQITIVFQPTACASPAGTKTNWRSDDRLGTLEFQLAVQSVPNGCPHWKMSSCEIFNHICKKNMTPKTHISNYTFFEVLALSVEPM